MGSSWTRAWTPVPCIGRRILNHCATREVRYSYSLWEIILLKQREERIYRFLWPCDSLWYMNVDVTFISVVSQNTRIYNEVYVIWKKFWRKTCFYYSFCRWKGTNFSSRDYKADFFFHIWVPPNTSICYTLLFLEGNFRMWHLWGKILMSQGWATAVPRFITQFCSWET